MIPEGKEKGISPIVDTLPNNALQPTPKPLRAFGPAFDRTWLSNWRSSRASISCFLLIAVSILLARALPSVASEQWVSSIRTSNQWAVFLCTDYWITNVCGTDKDYSDPGILPPTISIGDTVVYRNAKRESKHFTVRHINFFVYEEDVDFKEGGQRLTARKGDTSCSLFDVSDRSQTRASEYPSKIVIKGCYLSGGEKSEFPWLMTPYKYAHLTPNQQKIYLNGYFEAMGFILYDYSSPQDPNAMKQLNAWIDCVMDTKDSGKWNPELGWLFGENLKKSPAYVLYNTVSPLACKGYLEKAGTQVRTLRIYSYDHWKSFSLKDKAVYLSGYLDTVASFQMRLEAAGMKNDLRDLLIVIEATGLDGILSDVMATNFEPQYPLPWSMSRGLGAAHKRVLSGK